MRQTLFVKLEGAADPLLPLWEKVPEGRMRGSHLAFQSSVACAPAGHRSATPTSHPAIGHLLPQGEKAIAAVAGECAGGAA